MPCIFEFGREKTQNKPYVSFEIYVFTNERKKTFCNAFLKYKISKQLNNYQKSCKKSCEHLWNLNLAKSGEGERNADVLMGSDYYWMFFSRKIVKGTGHVTFMN